MSFKTEYPFELPRGYVDDEGNLHKRGIMRLATAKDEIMPLRDPRVQSNPSYLSIILLSRVITKLGDVRGINTETIEGLFSADLAFLQNFYQEINKAEIQKTKVSCPNCQHHFEVELDFFHDPLEG
jgi:phage FluMu protein gp41